MVASEIVAGKLYLSAIGQWPRVPARANPERWLDQFAPQERELAEALLDNLIFFSDELTTKLFAAAIHSLSSKICSGVDSYAAAKEKWSSFLDSCAITFPTGEVPGPTDSGHKFARLAKYELRFPENRIIQPEQLISYSWCHPKSNILFIDDFAGSGDQFLKTWYRSRTAPDRSVSSFASEFRTATNVYYLPLIATAKSFDRIHGSAPGVGLHTSHLLGNEYSVIDSRSTICPPNQSHCIESTLGAIASRAGFNGNPNGYDDLALTLAFEHSIPDATLPAIHEYTEDWEPLMRPT